jgi:hypothetical protein
MTLVNSTDKKSETEIRSYQRTGAHSDMIDTLFVILFVTELFVYCLFATKLVKSAGTSSINFLV